MKSNSFRLPSKATAVLLLCTGLVASHPLALWAEDGVTTVQAVQQQQVIVKGTVSDAMGPVIGANVIEKGNRGNGTITDIDGNFSLKVKPGATLEIHYIGYKTVEVKAVPGKPLNVTLTEEVSSPATLSSSSTICAPGEENTKSFPSSSRYSNVPSAL